MATDGFGIDGNPIDDQWIVSRGHRRAMLPIAGEMSVRFSLPIEPD